jgi:hypothetical protein
MRLRGKVDANQAAIVRALRQIGASVQSIADLGDGCPDLLVGFRGKVALMECKDGNQPPSKRRLTEEESNWHKAWQGPPVLIVESVEAALKFLNSIG